MADTAARTLALVTLLQLGSEWTGAELAGELGVSERTIRNDVERVRNLGYQIHSSRGPGGRYRLGAGSKVPPLVLSDDEAVALATALRAAPAAPVDAESRERVLVRLQQSLPEHLRERVQEVLSGIAPELEDPLLAPYPAAPASFGDLAVAIRDHCEVRFDYNAMRHRVEPYRLVQWRHRWFLVGRDARDRHWGCYRLDLIEPRGRGEQPFTPDSPADGDFSEFVLADGPPPRWRVRARCAVEASAERVLARLDPATTLVEYVAEDRCVVVTGADDLGALALRIAAVGVAVRVIKPPELRAEFAALGERCRRSARG